MKKIVMAVVILAAIVVGVLVVKNKQAASNAGAEVPKKEVAKTDEKQDGVLFLCSASMLAPMKTVLAAYAKDFPNEKVELSVGGSGEMFAQLTQTKKGDLILLHDPYMPKAEKDGLIAQSATLALLKPVIVVQKGNPFGVKSVADLGKPGIKIGVGDPRYSTCGIIVDNMLKKAPFGETLRANIKTTDKSHGALAAKMVAGALDAAILWNGVAFEYRDKLDILPFSEEYVDSVTSATYGVSDMKNVRICIGVTKTSTAPEAAQRFFDYAVKNAPAVFEASGYAVSSIKAVTPVEEAKKTK